MTEKSSALSSVMTTVITMAILGTGVVGLALMVVHGKSEPPMVAVEKSGATLVETAPVQVHREHLDVDVDGVVVPCREIAVAAEVGGRVIEKTDVCEAGKYVREGTLLVKIDPRDYKLEVLRLQEELKQAEVSLDELNIEEKNTQDLIILAKDSLALQNKELARLEELAKKSDRYVTASQLDTERRNVLTARNALVTLENQLRTTQARHGRLEAAKDLVQATLDKANLNLSRTEIKAPIDGMIVKDSVELDAYLAPGTTVAMIEDVSQCDVRCNLRMEELYWIWNQAQPSVPLDQETAARSYLLPPTPTTVVYKLGDHRYEWDGVLTRYDGIGLDETTRTVPCIVVVDKPNNVREAGLNTGQATRGPRALVRGMYVELKIHVQPESALLRVPVDAVQPGNKVLRVRNNILHVVPVHVVSVMGKYAVISAKQQQPSLDGNDKTLLPGDSVVISQMKIIHDGMSVQALPEKKL